MELVSNNSFKPKVSQEWSIENFWVAWLKKCTGRETGKLKQKGVDESSDIQ